MIYCISAWIQLSVSVLIRSHICAKVWYKSPSEDGWSLAWCCSGLSLPGVHNICDGSPQRGTLLMFLLTHNEGKGTDEALLMLQQNQTDRRCTLQEPVPHPNTEIMMTPLPSQCCSLHLFQSLSVKQPDWSAVLFCFSACVSVWSFCAIVQSCNLCTTTCFCYLSVLSGII